MKGNVRNKSLMVVGESQETLEFLLCDRWRPGLKSNKMLMKG
jgi:hypothetical protein